MTLLDAKLNTDLMIESVDIHDGKTKIRLLELGLIKGSMVVVKKMSVLKKTLLVAVSHACFTIKDELAKDIKVKYV